MRKKVVVFGGGTGLSTLLNGLKDFPLDITAIITVSDNGRSTGRLRQEFNTPAVGDIRKVISNLSDTDEDIKKMLEYRFQTSSDLNGHAVGNLILTSMLDITGSLKESIKHLSKLLDVRHTVLPISEDNEITLMATTKEGNIVEGECEITETNETIDHIFYKEEPKVLDEVIDAIKESDLIILSMGSLYTSLLPNIICRSVLDAIDKTTSPIMYVCNAMTQPGETDGFTVGDHIELINNYLNKRKIDVVIASNSKIDQKIIDKYSSEEQKDPVLIDKEKIESLNVELIEADIFKEENERLRHNSIKLASLIMFYLMRD
ncbi:MAG: YvcK family protein [Bacilli bacterium]|nr:YvcK family protein [Bacilli bacterium]